jgi:hypothetical protein
MADKTDQQYANDIRAAVQALYDRCHEAHAAGLTVHPPIMLMKWLMTGEGMGGPEDWTIKRASL